MDYGFGLDFIKLFVLFFVIFDPLMSFTVFFSATKDMRPKERSKTAMLSVLVAGILSALVWLLGAQLLNIFNTDLNDFKVAGGIVLGLLGIKMVMGQPLTENKDMKNRSAQAVAAIIGTPLLTGPAAITAIIIATEEHGHALSGLAILSVLIITVVIFLQASRIRKFMPDTFVQVTSTILGLINVAWGVMFITDGLIAIVQQST